MNATDMALNFRRVLLQTERMPKDDLSRYQADLLNKLVAHARAHSDWYAKWEEDVTHPAKWRGLPLLTRRQLQQEIKSIRARKLPPFCGDVQESFTSGSSGSPLRFYKDAIFDAASAAQTERLFTWWNVDGNTKLGSFMSTYTLAAHAGLSHRGQWRIGYPKGERLIIDLLVDLDRQVDWLAENKPDYLFVRGGEHLRGLAARAYARGLRIRPRLVLSTGSPMTESARLDARRIFKANVVDCYGASETGIIAYQCPDCGLYHCSDETVQVEVLRTDGTACTEGEIGRVVVSVLYGYATPLIRYEIGDYAMRGPEKASCGRSLSSISHIMGRYRNTFRLADGRLIHPYVNAWGLSQYLDYRQVQLVQIDLTTIEIRYVPATVTTKTPDEEVIQSFVRSAFDSPLDVRLVEVPEIVSGPAGKYEETLSLLNDSA